MPTRKPNRAAAGSGTIRQRSDGRWEARYTTGRDPGTGKQLQRSVYGATEREVRKALTRAMAALDSGTYAEPARMTVGGWLDVWLAEYMGDKKYLTVKGYKAQVNTHIKPAFGSVKLSTLKPHDIQRFYNTLQSGNAESAGLAPKSIRNIHGIFHKALSQAVALGYIRSNPADVVTLPRIIRKEVQPLTDEQVAAFLKVVDTDEYAALLKVILLLGLRESEAIGLTWDQVDFKAGTVLISKQLQKRPLGDGGYMFAPLKNDKTRLLTPAGYVMDLLMEQQSRQIEMRLRAGEAWQGWQNEKERKTALVFTNGFGRYLICNTVYNHFKRVAEAIGAPDACVHDLRHTYAVISLQSGDDPKTVQGNLGHHTAAFTLDVYD